MRRGAWTDMKTWVFLYGGDSSPQTPFFGRLAGSCVQALSKPAKNGRLRRGIAAVQKHKCRRSTLEACATKDGPREMVRRYNSASMRLLIAFLFTLPAWCADNTPVVDWVRANAIKLTTPEAGHGFDDMQPL